MKEHEDSITQQPTHASQKQIEAAWQAEMHRWVILIVLAGTGLFTTFFLVYLSCQALWGKSEPSNWLVELVRAHYPALVGTPMSAIAAFCIVSLLKVTNGQIHIEVNPAVKFEGASGPIILWILCFVSIAAAFYFLWGRSG
jgi:hypothetical protein